MKRPLDVGQVWEWSWDGRVEQHLLLWVTFSDDQEQEWRTFNLSAGKMWTVSFLNEWHDGNAWERLS